jgi:hypothetical protein
MFAVMERAAAPVVGVGIFSIAVKASFPEKVMLGNAGTSVAGIQAGTP